MNRLNGFLSNDSVFGKLMIRVGIIIAGNILFLLFSIPVITIGASLTGLYTVMLKTLRGDGVINPFLAFWDGFKTNFKQATIAWITLVVLFVIGYLDIRICQSASGIVADIQYALYAGGIFLLIGAIFLFPTMSAFDNKLLFLFRTGYYFALKKPLKLLVILALHILPFMLTYLDASLQPLYVFMWFFFGFGAIAMATSSYLLPEFTPFLPLVDSAGN